MIGAGRSQKEINTLLNVISTTDRVNKVVNHVLDQATKGELGTFKSHAGTRGRPAIWKGVISCRKRNGADRRRGTRVERVASAAVCCGRHECRHRRAKHRQAVGSVQRDRRESCLRRGGCRAGRHPVCRGYRRYLRAGYSGLQRLEPRARGWYKIWIRKPCAQPSRSVVSVDFSSHRPQPSR